MNATILSFVFAGIVLAVAAADDKPCYNWDILIFGTKLPCAICKKIGAPRIDFCIYSLWLMTDKDGNVPMEKLRNSFLITLEESKKEAVKDVLKDCGKNQTSPFTDSREIGIFWKCCDIAISTVCPEYAQQLIEWDKDDNLRDCITY